MDASAGPVALDMPGGRVDPTAFVLSPDGSNVVYRKNQLDPEVVELFLAPADGTSAARLLNEPFPTNAYTGAVRSFQTSSTRAAYVMNDELFGVNALGTPLQIELAPGARVSTYFPPLLVPGGDAVLVA